MAGAATMATRRTMPISCRPAQAIQSRLRALSSMPAWAAFLPTEVQTSLEGQLLAVRTPYEETMCTAAPSSESQDGYGMAGANHREDGWTRYQSPHQEAEGGWSAGHADSEAEGARPSCSVQALRGQVWAQSRDADGTWIVQQAFQEASSDDERELLAQELKGHVWEAIRCPHANFVLQKCITVLKPRALQFIIDEIKKPGKQAAHHAAKHRYGCRVLERLIENCPPSAIAPLLEDLLTDAKSLCVHSFGHFVMQHLIENECEQAPHIIQILRENVATMAVDQQACSVVAKALRHGSDDDRTNMASALIQSEGVIASMACSRYGHTAVKEALEVLAKEGKEDDFNNACRQLLSYEADLRRSRYGKVVLAFTKRLLESE